MIKCLFINIIFKNKNTRLLVLVLKYCTFVDNLLVLNVKDRLVVFVDNKR